MNTRYSRKTCLKYAAKKAAAMESLRDPKKAPTCRFHFCRVLLLVVRMSGVERKRRVRQRGKPLVPVPYIETSDERGDRYRCKVVREQPFRSASTDVGQATVRCNIDAQYLPCGPLFAESDLQETSAAVADLGETRTTAAPQRGARVFPWLGKNASLKLTATKRIIVETIAATFQKAHGMDFYITKYQAKTMQALAPLFATMAHGVQRLEQEEEAAEAAALPNEEGHPAKAKKRRSVADSLVPRTAEQILAFTLQKVLTLVTPDTSGVGDELDPHVVQSAFATVAWADMLDGVDVSR